MGKGKERLDLLLVRQGLAASREKAKSLIMSGVVFAKGLRLEKPGMELAEDTLLELKGKKPAFVSRGGLKLAKAIEVFKLDFRGQVVADIGASTGGFTDCVLKNGAARVYAIDVGYGQLAWNLRTDPCVISLERTNARYLTESSLPEKMDWIVSDVAFISITKIFPAMSAVLKEKGQMLILIKPQFEAGREKVGKKGVVKDPAVHCQVLYNVLEEAQTIGFEIKGLDFSPIRGPEGNIEYLAWLSRPGLKAKSFRNLIEDIVAKAQRETI
ncbi:MAG: TlyA family RNA methyltransferase [Desulfitobacteriaceae bacterium]|nr:TlyA family RNA methyltransferase [Desulfitobacteriaceae bacterium]MDD4346123.1 TlyA family RNA methyltransferase [Desulfitobacteriaceae bacterium]MDD4401083.1 TlyA family RNA methyltransferase [Desulfitobacteriaceae bacterium]